MIIYVGAHYLYFSKNKETSSGSYTRDKWRLFDDAKTITFRSWADVANYCIE